MGAGVATAGASSTTCRCSLTKPPRCLTTWAMQPPWCCMAIWNPPSSTLAGHARPLPPAAGRSGASRAAARGAVSERRPVLHPVQGAPPAGDPPGVTMSSTTRTSSPTPTCPWCAAPKTRCPVAGPHPQHAPPRAAAGRERRTTGKPARLPARIAAQPSRLRCADGIPVEPRREGRYCHRSASPRVFGGWRKASISSPKPSCFAAGPTTRRRKKQEQVSDVEALIKDLAELNIGDPVVHSAHGIGRYRGLVNMDVGNKNPDGSPASRNSCTWSTQAKRYCMCR